MSTPRFEWAVYGPIVKAVEDELGRLWVHGIASDESVDLENEIIKASGLVDTVDLLEQRGVFNWDHGERVIGKVTKAQLIPVAQAMEMFPEISEEFARELQGEKAFYLQGYVDAPDQHEPNSDLENARWTLKKGYPLGFSLQGGRVRQGAAVASDGSLHPATEQAIVTKVALTTCPINLSSYATLMKSVSQAVAHLRDHPDDRDGLPIAIIAKGMAAGGGTDAASFTGGRALTRESLDRKTATVTWECPGCAIRVTRPPREKPKCPQCRGAMTRVSYGTGGGVRKAAVHDAFERITAQLSAERKTMPKGDQMMSNTLNKGIGLLRAAIGVLSKAAKAPDEDEEDRDRVEAVDEGDEDEVPTDEELMDELEGLNEDVKEGEEAPAEDEEEPEEEEEEEEEEERPRRRVRKSVVDTLMDDPQWGPAIEADAGLRLLLEEFEGRQSEGLKTLSKAVDSISKGLGVVGEGLAALLRQQHEQEQERAARAQAVGALPMPTGYRVMNKGVPGDDEQAKERTRLHGVVTSALQKGVMTATDARVHRLRIDNADVSEATRALASIEQALTA